MKGQETCGLDFFGVDHSRRAMGMSGMDSLLCLPLLLPHHPWMLSMYDGIAQHLRDQTRGMGGARQNIVAVAQNSDQGGAGKRTISRWSCGPFVVGVNPIDAGRCTVTNLSFSGSS